MKLVKKIHCKKFQSVYFTGCLYFSSCFFCPPSCCDAKYKMYWGKGKHSRKTSICLVHSECVITFTSAWVSILLMSPTV